MPRRLLSLLSALILACLTLPAAAQEQEVDLALVLLADTTGSIDNDELLFQRQGYAEAMTDPEVLAAIQSSLRGAIAVTYVEWAAEGSQGIVVPWTVISDETSAQRFARDVMLPPRMAFGRNAIGAALLRGKALLGPGAPKAWRRVIDFSGDSVRNFSGPGIAEARAEVLADGITINALAILCRGCSGTSSPDLGRAYEEQIIGGPGAFVVVAEDEKRFAEAVKRKLILEIAGNPAQGALQLARD